MRQSAGPDPESGTMVKPKAQKAYREVSAAFVAALGGQRSFKKANAICKGRRIFQLTINRDANLDRWPGNRDDMLARAKATAAHILGNHGSGEVTPEELHDAAVAAMEAALSTNPQCIDVERVDEMLRRNKFPAGVTREKVIDTLKALAMPDICADFLSDATKQTERADTRVPRDEELGDEPDSLPGKCAKEP
jgi:hypothetical protein